MFLAGVQHRGLPRRRQPLDAAHPHEGPVRQLRGAEDDRRGGAQPAQGAHAQDPPPHQHAAEVHLRSVHFMLITFVSRCPRKVKVFLCVANILIAYLRRR